MMQTFFKYLSINTLEDLVPSHLSVPKKTLAFSQRTRNHWNSPGCQPTKPGTLTPRCRHPAPRRQISSMELHASPWRSSGSQKWCASSSAKCKKQAILHWLWAHQKEGFGVDFVLGVLGERWSRWGVTRLWRAVLFVSQQSEDFHLTKEAASRNRNTTFSLHQLTWPDPAGFIHPKSGVNSHWFPHIQTSCIFISRH